jgi:integrase
MDLPKRAVQERSRRKHGPPFARCVRAAGMNDAVVVPHTMRHTAITRLAAMGARIKTIQEFSGHESLAMVLRYAHAQDHVVDSVLDRLEEGTVVEHLSKQSIRR